MQTLSTHKITTLVTFVFMLVISFNGAAQDDKAALVDQIIQQSSIKIAVQGIPQQLAQLPQMFPISADDQGAFVEDFMVELSSHYNETDALSSMRRYFIENGEMAKLLEIQTWLVSPMGRRVTQTELLSQQQIDVTKLQHFMQSYKPKEGDIRHQQYIRLVNSLDLGSKVFSLLEDLAPKMFDIFAQHSSTATGLSREKAESASVLFQEQLSEMKANFDAAVGPQMATAMAYQFQDLSDDELTAYANFAETEAGQHFYDLTLMSSTDYSSEWVLNILPGLAQKLEAVSH
jgi:hypothetical protein